MRFKLSSEAKKFIDSQEKNTANRIYQHLREATQNPPKGDIIIMSDNSGRYRMRVGGFRFLYKITGNLMLVVKISTCGDAYKK